MFYIKSIFILLLAFFLNGMFPFPFPFTPPWNHCNNQTGGTYIVDNTTDTLSCEGGASFYSTIQDAIDASSDNSNIYICDGTYNESVTINNNKLYIKKSDSANGDVIVSHNDTVFKLNRVKNIFFESIKIISASNDGIKAERDVGDFGIKNCEITALDNGIQLSRSTKYLSITDSNITASNNGVLVNRRVKNGIDLTNTNITATNYGFIIVRDVRKKINIINTNIHTSMKDTIHFSREIYNDVNISNSSLISGDDGIEFDRYLDKKISISNTKIQSVGNSIYFHRSIDGGINIDNVDINSTFNTGIKFLRNVNHYCNMNKVNISSFDRSLYFNTAFINPTITNSSFFSKNSDAIYVKTRGWSNLILRDSCLKTEESSSYGLNLHTNNSASDILNNCFYATATNKLAKAKRANNNFDGNYWDNHFGNYNMNNVDDSNVALTCQNSCWTQNNTNNKFDAWDITRDINDKNISTKKAGDTFSIFIASLNDTKDNYQKFSGTVCSCIDNNSSTCFKNQFSDSNNSSQTPEGNPTFTINKAFKTTNIDIHWQKDADVTCSALVEDNSTNSTDNFAIIPTRFILELNSSTLRAGESYKLTIDATNSSNSTISSYGQTFSLNENDKNLSQFFNSKLNGLEFETTYPFEINGSGSKNDFKIDDVGQYLIKLVDTLYAIVDADDTDLSERTIDGNISILVTPHHFDLNITKHQVSTAQEWAYMAQDFKDMNYTLEATLTAKNKQNTTTSKFDKDEYAIDVNTTITFDTNLTDSEISKFYNQFDNDFNINTKEFNTSKKSFNNGVSSISLIYKIDKNTTTTLRPVRTNIKDIDLPEYTDSEKNISSLDDSITWYYSKLITYDVSTNTDITPTHFFVLLYKENTKNFQEVTLNWFKNSNDNSSITTGFSFTPSSNTNINNTTGHVVDFIDYSQGRVDYNITKDGDKKAIIHIGIPKYLWYNYGVDSDYNISSGSNCIQHPCSTYTYEVETESEPIHSISSGDYKGGNAPVKKIGKHIRHGVKVFR